MKLKQKVIKVRKKLPSFPSHSLPLIFMWPVQLYRPHKSDDHDKTQETIMQRRVGSFHIYAVQRNTSATFCYKLNSFRCYINVVIIERALQATCNIVSDILRLSLMSKYWKRLYLFRQCLFSCLLQWLMLASWRFHVSLANELMEFNFCMNERSLRGTPKKQTASDEQLNCSFLKMCDIIAAAERWIEITRLFYLIAWHHSLFKLMNK